MTKREDRFVEFYLQTWNASEAARRAEYRGKPNVTGARLLAKDSIRAKIAERMASTAMDTDEVLIRLAQIARNSIGDFITIRNLWTVEPIDPDDEDSELIRVRNQQLEIDYEAVKNSGYLVKKLGITKYGPTIEMQDSLSALAKIGDALGIFRQRVSLENPDGSKLESNVVFHFHYPDNGRPDREE